MPERICRCPGMKEKHPSCLTDAITHFNKEVVVRETATNMNIITDVSGDRVGGGSSGGANAAILNTDGSPKSLGVDVTTDCSLPDAFPKVSLPTVADVYKLPISTTFDGNNEPYTPLLDLASPGR